MVRNYLSGLRQFVVFSRRVGRREEAGETFFPVNVAAEHQQDQDQSKR